MDNPQTKKVSLMIHGNPQAIAGYQPIFYINQPDFTPPSDNAVGGMARNDFFFVVNISQAFTNIVLVHNNIRSVGASRDGVLKISIAIPQGYALADGKTPYDLLCEVREVFVTRYMDSISGLTGGYRFRQSMPGPEMIQAVVDKYSYIRAGLPHRRMTGVTNGYLVTDRPDLLLSDLQYPEFAGYKEIIVGKFCDATPKIAVSSIPRRREWRLRVNGEFSALPRDIFDINIDRINVSIPIDNPELYQPASVSFTLDEARAGGVRGISINEAEMIIDVRLAPEKRAVRMPPPFTPSANHSTGFVASLWLLIMTAVVSLLLGLGIGWLLPQPSFLHKDVEVAVIEGIDDSYSPGDAGIE